MRRKQRQAVYEPLTDYLKAQPGPGITLRFTEVDDLLGAPLPPAAWSAAWWSNTQPNSVHQRAWLCAGWRVARVDVWAQTVTFEREAGDGIEHRAGP